MEKIHSPLRYRMRDEHVRNLQEALVRLIARRVFLSDDKETRRALLAMLKIERKEKRYGAATTKLIRWFQKERGMSVNGSVDAATAEALNSLLEEHGVISVTGSGETETVRETIETLTSAVGILSAAVENTPIDTRYAVACRVVDARGKAVPDLRVEAFDQDPVSPHDPLGEPAVTDREGQVCFRFKTSDFSEHPGEKGPDLYFKIYRHDIRLDYTIENLKNDKGIIRDYKPGREPIILRVEKHHVVTGTILQSNGRPAAGVELFVNNVGFGGETSLLGRVKTDAEGAYALVYDSGKAPANLDILTADPGEPNETLPLTATRFGATADEVLNLVAPAAAGAPEYDRLIADLTPHVGGVAKLADAVEDDHRQDITLLNRASGWDARLIALVAAAERMTRTPQVIMPREVMYGLLRAGLPSDPLLLAKVAPEVAVKALSSMRDAGIVGLSDKDLNRFEQMFVQFSVLYRFELPAPGSKSTYKTILAGSGLPDDAQNAFVPIYLDHADNPEKLWEASRKKGLSEAHVARLRLQGKLAFLCGNSAEMIRRLMDRQIEDPTQLVAADLFLADAWVDEILDAVGVRRDDLDSLKKDKVERLEELIPTAYAGEEIADRVTAYAEDMARKMRLSYPTSVTARLLRIDDRYRLPEAHDDTVALLDRATAQGFRLGETPANAFLKKHPGVTSGMAEETRRGAEKSLAGLQRTYQISPSNEAMSVLLSLGITSAHDVKAYEEATFLALFEARFQALFGREPEFILGQWVLDKSNQVSSVTYNLFSIAGAMSSQPPVAGISPSVEAKESFRRDLIKRFPTMESLFGAMDYCDCDHCRSVLSPAAYLVDLLQFIDPEPSVWANTVASWEARHDGAPYPHVGDGGDPMTPYDVLVSRRPDLPHIPLTCENTNTVMPYIDLVNEILEYYVVHGELGAEAVGDTGGAVTEALLAEPGNVIQEAYRVLRDDACYPLELPFDLPLETARRFCEYFKTPLAEVLDIFRSSHALLAPEAVYDRFGVFMESLGLSPVETAGFIATEPLSDWHTLYGYDTPAAAMDAALDEETGQRLDLNSAKTLSRRLGIDYEALTRIIRTDFVNPELDALGLLYKLGVSIRDVQLFRTHGDLIGRDPDSLSSADQQRRLEVMAVSDRLARHAAEYGVTETSLAAELAHIPFDRILVLADPETGCSFDETILRYADGAAAASIDFLRINLFVRLWRKLGWSIDEVDRALVTFIPENVPFDAAPAHLAARPLGTALIYLSHLKALATRLSLDASSRSALVDLWSNMATSGENAAYVDRFLTPDRMAADPVFDHPLGRYLEYFDEETGRYEPFRWDPSRPEDAAAGNVSLANHLLALEGALGLDATEIGHILADVGWSLEHAPLTLALVSILRRYKVLADGLSLSIDELIILKQLSGRDPFRPLSPDPIDAVDTDYPLTHTLWFVDIVETVKASGLSVRDVDYLIRHRFDAVGERRPDVEGTDSFIKSMIDGIRTIRETHRIPSDPGAVTEEQLRQTLSLVLSPEVVTTFLAMLNGSVEYIAVQGGVAPEMQLDPESLRGIPAIRELRYDSVRRQQTLVFKGVLPEVERTALLAGLPDTVATPFLGDLLNDVQQQARTFFEKYLMKQPAGTVPAFGFLAAAEFELLFEPDPVAPETPQERMRRPRARLVDAFWPYLHQQLIHRFIITSLVVHTGVEPDVLTRFVTDEQLLSGGDGPLSAVFAAGGDRGVTADAFDASDLSGTPRIGVACLSTVDTALFEGDGAVGSARFRGYLEVPADGVYRFTVGLERAGATASLAFDHLADSVFLQGTAADAGAIIGNGADEYLVLTAGRLYGFTLTVQGVDGGRAQLLVRGEQLPNGPLSRLNLYPEHAVDPARRALLLLGKCLELAGRLDVNGRELAYLAAHADRFDDIDFNTLPTEPVGDGAEDDTAAEERFQWLLRLIAYTRLRREMVGGSDDMIDLFELNEIGDTAGLHTRIAELTRRESGEVTAVVDALFDETPSFDTEIPVARLWQGLQATARIGVPAHCLKAWTRIVDTGVTNEERFEIVRDLKSAIKARFDSEGWQRTAREIFDTLRQRKRDALVSRVLHLLDLERVEQLYEYFLIDPGMEPVVQTSRIRLAVSSVQLFIQRCLMNLEKKVDPAGIKGKQWEWMKRYRVWEANRKIFLFPENWLEPELRDDKTHLFTELEGILLQDDVSPELVEDAFLGYLKKLDALAKLDVAAMHIEDAPDPADRVLHVFGRTFSLPHKYFYRRFAHEMWTPWELVNVDIEGDHLAPVVWRDRLYLFWVTFMEKPDKQPGVTGEGSDTALTDLTLHEVVDSMQTMADEKIVEAQLHWSEYLNGEWRPRESGGYAGRAIFSETVPKGFEPSDVMVHVSVEQGGCGGVYISLTRKAEGRLPWEIYCFGAFYLAGRNCQPEAIRNGLMSPAPRKPVNPYSAENTEATRYSGRTPLEVTYRQHIETEGGRTTDEVEETLSILKKGGGFTLLPCNGDISLAGPLSRDLAADRPEAVAEAIEGGLREIAALQKPFFVQTPADLFFVAPEVVETTVEEWLKWVASPPQSQPELRLPDEWLVPVVVAQAPRIPEEVDPGIPAWKDIHPGALIEPDSGIDWLINDSTLFVFNNQAIARNGRVGEASGVFIGAEARAAGDKRRRR